MDRSPGPPYSWHLVDAPPGASDDDALDAALESEHATLAYGEHCFEFTSKVGSDGDCLLRLHELGRLTTTASGRSILVFAREGHEAEERIVPCHDALDRIARPAAESGVLVASGRALLADAARLLDDEERAS